MDLTFTQLMLFVISYGVIVLVVYFKYVTPRMNAPFNELEEHNNKIKEMFNHIDQYTDPLEKIIHGMEYIFGEDYLQPNEIPQTRMQESLASTLVICVLYDTLRPTVTEDDEK